MTKLGEFTEALILKQAQHEYDHGEARVPLRVSSTSLLCVDLLKEFVEPQWSPLWIPEATRQVSRIRNLQEACRRLGIPIIHIGYETTLQGLDGPAPMRKVPISSSMQEFIGQLVVVPEFFEPVAPQPGELIVLKHTYSAFHGTALETLLRNLGIETVVIAGTMTNFCCGATAREAYWHGFHVVMGSDVNSSDDAACHAAELRTLRRGYARILESSDIIAELEASQDDPSRRPS